MSYHSTLSPALTPFHTQGNSARLSDSFNAQESGVAGIPTQLDFKVHVALTGNHDMD